MGVAVGVAFCLGVPAGVVVGVALGVAFSLGVPAGVAFSFGVPAPAAGVAGDSDPAFSLPRVFLILATWPFEVGFSFALLSLLSFSFPVSSEPEVNK